MPVVLGSVFSQLVLIPAVPQSVSECFIAEALAPHVRPVHER